MKVGLLGLGQMGREMAVRLIDAGHQVKVWNRSPLKFKTSIESHAGNAIEGAEIVITMLADDAAIRAVWLDSGLAKRLPQDAIHLNMATVSLGIARELAQAHGAGRYVSAPVFGRPVTAAKGELDVIAAGPPQAIERCQALFKAMARQVFVVGTAPEQANAVKIARNFLLATVIEGLGEAIALARKAGVPVQTFVDIVTGTSLNAPAYKNYGKLMVERSFEPAQFPMKLGIKDVELALATARELGVALPSAELIRRNILAAIERGDGDKDWAALAEYLPKP